MSLTTLAVAVSLLCTAGPNEGSRATITVLDRSLRATTGEAVSLTAERAVVRVGGKDVAVEQPAAAVQAALWSAERDWPGLPEEPAADATAYTVELTDLSRLRGDLLAGKGDGLVLVNPRLGRVDLTLDSLRWLATGRGAPPEAERARSADRVRLVNGDTLEGFVEGVAPATESGATGLAVSIERAGEKSKSAVPLERVAWVSLGGAGAARRGPATTVWLTEGERTSAEEFSIDKREARLVRSKGALPARFEASAVRGVVLAPGTLTPLAGCAATGSLVTGPEQALGTRDLELAEPGRVAWTLPPGATRLKGWAVLPEECRRLGDCEVAIALEGVAQPLKSFVLTGAAPVVAIDLELPEGRSPLVLSLTLSEGRHGPVQDRVVLRRALVGIGR